MSITAMRVAKAAAHPNADALRVYTFEAPGVAPTVVVANLEHVYQVGDVVAVARVGAVLRDGTRIRAAKLRGHPSFGMAMGLTPEQPGDDLTAQLGRKPPSGELPTAQFCRWPSIEQLPGLRRTLGADGEALPRVTYRAKVKLDGTNAGVAVLPEGVAAQSRSRWISPADDNQGFAAWLDAQPDWAAQLCDALEPHTVIYGEWAGQGIQRRTSISRLDRRIFAVFAVQVGDPSTQAPRVLVEPEAIAALLPPHPDVYVLPWHGDAVDLDFATPEQLAEAAEHLNTVVLEVEACDPWVAEVFGRDGLGEGVVCYPIARDGASLLRDGFIDREALSLLMFKGKGEKHQTVRQKKAVQITPEVVANIDAFVQLVLTTARLEQGVVEGARGQLERSRTGDFLRWVAADVRKETAAELEAAGLTWKQVGRALGHAARAWFHARADQLGPSAPRK